jgi:NAD(P)-dependent dehydrogenase (short-subunit alcohol dehydrogenase family)
VLVARSRGDLDAVAGAVHAAGSQALVRPCDLTDADAVAACLSGLDRVDVLVNGAGANRPEPFLDVDPETLAWLWEVNVASVFFASQSAARQMVRQGDGGAIVTISSQMGHVGAPSRTAYCATKHAVEGFTRALAVELAPDGIRALTVAPTFVRTALTAAQLDDPAMREALLGQIPMGRFATPADVAAAVVFAASDEAAMLTGTSLVVDGGWTAR